MATAGGSSGLLHVHALHVVPPSRVGSGPLRHAREQLRRHLGEPISRMDVATTRLATIKSASVILLPAIRQPRASQRFRSRAYRTKPAEIPSTPVGMRIHRYCIVTAMNAPLPSPKTITASGRRQQSDDSPAPTQAARPAPIEPSLIASCPA